MSDQELVTLKARLEAVGLSVASVSDWLIAAAQGNEEGEQDTAFLTGCPRCDYRPEAD